MPTCVRSTTQAAVASPTSRSSSYVVTTPDRRAGSNDCGAVAADGTSPPLWSTGWSCPAGNRSSSAERVSAPMAAMIEDACMAVAMWWM